MCLLTTFIYIIVPAIALKNVYQNFHLADTKEMKEKYGAFYEGLAINKGKKVLF